MNDTLEITVTVRCESQDGDDPGVMGQQLCDAVQADWPYVKEAQWDYDDDAYKALIEEMKQ